METAGASSPSSSSSSAFSSACILYIVRHGETDWNVEGRLQGHIDIPLNAHGIEQARAAGKRLASLLSPASSSSPSSPFSGTVHVYASDLVRAHRTAEIIVEELNAHARALDPSFPPLSVVVDRRLRETKLGDWEGMTWEDVQRDRAHEIERRKVDENFAMPNGESTRQRFHRVACALRDIARRHGGNGMGGVAAPFSSSSASPPFVPQHVVVVSHGGVMDEMGRFVLSCRFGARTNLHRPNAAINIIGFTPNDSSAVSVAAAGGGGGGGGAPGGDDDDDPLFAQATIDPRTAAGSVGKWEIITWGDTDHLKHVHPPASKQPSGEAAGASSSAAAAGADGGGGAVAAGAQAPAAAEGAEASIETEGKHAHDEEVAVSG